VLTKLCKLVKLSFHRVTAGIQFSVGVFRAFGTHQTHIIKGAPRQACGHSEMRAMHALALLLACACLMLLQLVSVESVNPSTGIGSRAARFRSHLQASKVGKAHAALAAGHRAKTSVHLLAHARVKVANNRCHTPQTGRCALKLRPKCCKVDDDTADCRVSCPSSEPPYGDGAFDFVAPVVDYFTEKSLPKPAKMVPKSCLPSSVMDPNIEVTNDRILHKGWGTFQRLPLSAEVPTVPETTYINADPFVFDIAVHNTMVMKLQKTAGGNALYGTYLSKLRTGLVQATKRLLGWEDPQTALYQSYVDKYMWFGHIGEDHGGRTAMNAHRDAALPEATAEQKWPLMMPHAWGLHIIIPYRKADVEAVRANTHPFMKQTPTLVQPGDNKIEFFTGNSHIRTLFMRVVRAGVAYTVAIKGAGNCWLIDLRARVCACTCVCVCVCMCVCVA